MESGISINEIPRSNTYANKIIIKEGFLTVRGINYYARCFDDSSAELVRKGMFTDKWVFLLFPGEEKPNAVENIKKAIKQHFNPFPQKQGN
mgnify:FL=1